MENFFKNISGGDKTDFSLISLSLASPEKIRQWSYGEVRLPETLNYRTFRPEPGGLFCAQIFGPIKDYECLCGKYKRMKYRGVFCEKCRVEVTATRVRRERMGHIKLACPVAHILFFKSVPSRIALMLDLTMRDIERILYYEAYIVTNPRRMPDLKRGQMLSAEDCQNLHREHGISSFNAGTGAEGLRDVLKKIDLDYDAKFLREELKGFTNEEQHKLFTELKKDKFNLKNKETIEAIFRNEFDKDISEKRCEILFERLKESSSGGEVVIKKILRDALSSVSSEALKKRMSKRLKLVENFLRSNIRPEWMILESLPVLPADLRPLVQLEGGRFTNSDINDLYRRVINRNNRLSRLIELNAPEVIINNEKRMLQEAVDSLLDNGRRGKPAVGTNKRPLKSLVDAVKGKTGRFRQNLLGKRVDFSGRTVIVVGPTLKLHQCGLPKQMALILFRPFVFNRLIKNGYVSNIKQARAKVDNADPEIWGVLEEVIRQHPVLLNRAPTLHRLGIQAFEPVLIEGKAIQLHPLVCMAFNADFDGDQMAVHVPLSLEAQTEARVLMLSSNNVLAPANGEPIIVPSQDIIFGLYYTTREDQGAIGTGMRFVDVSDVENALAAGIVSLQAPIYLHSIDNGENNDAVDSGHKNNKDNIMNKYKPNTTVGRSLFLRFLPPKLDFSLVNKTLTKRDVSNLVNISFRVSGLRDTVFFCDSLMRFGFEMATKSGVSICIDDIIVPDSKNKIIASTEKEIHETQKQFRKGLITDDERHNKSIDLWDKASEEISRVMMDGLSQEVVKDEKSNKIITDKKGKTLYQSSFNSIYMMSNSGARGSQTQIKQLAGIRGLMTRPDGRIMETAITANFREGLSVLQYFISTHGGRKGLADTALKTANSGYLTRRLVDVTQDVVILEGDCNSKKGIVLRSILMGGEIAVSLRDRVLGRYLADDVRDPMADKILFPAGTYITEVEAEKIDQAGVDTVKVRSPVTCEVQHGLCVKCYGRDLGRGGVVGFGEAVGVIAAQSIGEPGTQLTMRTFHIGGAASRDVDARFIDCKTDGVLKITDVRSVTNRRGEMVVVSPSGEVSILDKNKQERERYRIKHGDVFSFKDSDKVKAGQRLLTRDPSTRLIIAEYEGVVKLENIELEVNAREQIDELTGLSSIIITEKKLRSGKKVTTPQMRFLDKDGELVNKHGTDTPVAIALPSGSILTVNNGSSVKIGDVIVKIPQAAGKSRDITGGLPRVAELFEAREPKLPEILAKATGRVSLRPMRRNKQVIVIIDQKNKEHEHQIAKNRDIIVQDGSHTKKGEAIVAGDPNPHDILEMRSIEALVAHIVSEVQEVYRLQGVNINDKHIEVIVHQMLRCGRITDCGGSKRFVDGEQVLLSDVLEENKILEEEGKKPAKYKTILLGITKSSLAAYSFISAASFQETTRVLTEAAVGGRLDHLRGLKENVIVGRLVPAGTGYIHYQEQASKRESEAEEMIRSGLTEGDESAPEDNIAQDAVLAG